MYPRSWSWPRGSRRTTASAWSTSAPRGQSGSRQGPPEQAEGGLPVVDNTILLRRQNKAGGAAPAARAARPGAASPAHHEAPSPGPDAGPEARPRPGRALLLPPPRRPPPGPPHLRLPPAVGPLAAQRRGIPAFHFMTSGAASTAFFCHYGSRTSAEAFPFPAIRLGSPDEDVQYAAMLNKEANGLSDKDRLLRSLERSSGFIAIKSFREIESEYIGYLSSLTGKEVVPVGPLVPDADPAEDDDDDSEGRRQLERVVGWLGKRGAGSVVFVSFGTEYFMTEEETEELACGLELSGPASSGWWGEEEEEDEGGEGWCWRVGPRSGASWRTPASGLPHALRVELRDGRDAVRRPMVALPLHLDQPMNARLVVELGVGVACTLPPRPHESTFKRDDVARGIREVLLPATERGREW
uniref:Uncharacterized protein n=1 Tax=Ananas comosus var. bracteatus TaxID=296719 RepID=A0A6V7PVZ7_ANACO|nr:unnamed protein product [Ananas comosus var. bracteatus]